MCLFLSVLMGKNAFLMNFLSAFLQGFYSKYIHEYRLGNTSYGYEGWTVEPILSTIPFVGVQQDQQSQFFFWLWGFFGQRIRMTKLEKG